MFINRNIEYLYNSMVPSLNKIIGQYTWKKIGDEPLDIELEKPKALVQNYTITRSYVVNDKMIMMGEVRIVLPPACIKSGSIEMLRGVLKNGDGFNCKIENNILFVGYSIKYTPDPVRIISLSANFLLSLINFGNFYLTLVEILSYYDKLSYDDFRILYQNAYNKNQEFMKIFN